MSSTSRPLAHPALRHRRPQTLPQVPPPPLRSQLKLAASYPSPGESPHAPPAASTPAGSSSTPQAPHRNQHRLVVASLPLLRGKQRHRNHEQILTSLNLQHLDRPSQHPPQRLSPPHASAHTSAYAPSHADSSSIHRIRDCPLKLRRRHPARRAQQTLHRKLPRKPNALHIESLAAPPAQRHRLPVRTQSILVTNRREISLQQRPTTGPQSQRINRRNQIIHRSPNHPSRPPQQRRHRALCHPPRRRTGLAPGNKPERIVVQAFAEDSPHSPALQVGRTAPCPQYKPSSPIVYPSPSTILHHR